MAENDLSTKIRDLRAMHSLTLEQVAQQVGVGRSTIRKWETGMIRNMRRDKIAKLAAALHTTPGYLMGWEEKAPTPKGERLGDRNVIRILGRDGSAVTKILTDEQLRAFLTMVDHLPEADDL